MSAEPTAQDERPGAARPGVPGVRWCLAAALATGLIGVGLSIGLRERLRTPADPAGLQSRLDAWKKLDETLTPAERTTGPKRPKN